MTVEKRILIIHDLEPKLLEKSISRLMEISEVRDIRTIHLSEFMSGIETDMINDHTKILVLHLDLNDEIKNHELISNHAKLHGIKELNSYSNTTEIFDNKYKFYKFMLANDLEQLKTDLIEMKTPLGRASKYILDFKSQNKLSSIILKPCHGTESRDQLIINNQFSPKDLNDYLENVLNYDSIIIQDFLLNAKTTKLLIYQGKTYSKTANTVTNKLSQEFIEALKLSGQDIPGIFSLDILISAEQNLILEANSRPAAIYKYL